jgi:hypothetical protein
VQEFRNIPPFKAGRSILLASKQEFHSLPYFNSYKLLENIYLDYSGVYIRECIHSRLGKGNLKLALADGKLQGFLEFEVAEYYYVQNDRPSGNAKATAEILETGSYQLKTTLQTWSAADWWYENLFDRVIGFELIVGGAPTEREKAIGKEAVSVRLVGDSFSLWGKGKNTDYRPYRILKQASELGDDFALSYDPSQDTLETLIRSKCLELMQQKVPFVNVADRNRNVDVLPSLEDFSSDPLSSAIDLALAQLDITLNLL